MKTKSATWRSWTLRLVVMLLMVPAAAACGSDALPSLSDLAEGVKELPGVPAAIEELPAILDDLPKMADLPAMQTPAGAILYNGPTEYRVALGERIPGTDIQLTAINEEDAEFAIAGMRSVRKTGDSLDYDGDWGGLDGSTYNLRSRIYRIGKSSVRAGGVHQLTIEEIAPIEGEVGSGAHTVRFPYSTGAAAGDTFSGMTYGYVGANDRGGEISGLPPGYYPYRKVGDSIEWHGLLRSDIPVEYALRMVLYGETSARIGGVVKVSLPNN